MRTQPPEPVKLAPADEEKVSNIAEVCQVSREEALRVLDACHMDETMALERILNGNGLSSWSEVSKKKKPPSSQNRSASRASYVHSSDRERERRGDRRDRDRDRSQSRNAESGHSMGNGGRRPGGRLNSNYHNPRSRDALGSGHYAGRKRTPYTSQNSSSGTIPIGAKPSQEALMTPSPKPDGSSISASAASGAPQLSSSPSGNERLDQSQTNGDTIGVDTWSGARGLQSWGDDSSGVGAQQTWGDDSTGVGAQQAWGDEQAPSSVASNAWGVKDPAADHQELPTNESGKADVTSRKPDLPIKRTNVPPVSTVKRTFNYAAAAAAGTSHEKPALVPVMPEKTISSPNHVASVPERVTPSASERVTPSASERVTPFSERATPSLLERVTLVASEQVTPTASERVTPVIPPLITPTVPERVTPTLPERVSPPVTLPSIEPDPSVNENVDEMVGEKTNEARQHRTTGKKSSRVLSDSEQKLESGKDRGSLPTVNGPSVEIVDATANGEKSPTPTPALTPIRKEPQLKSPQSVPTNAWTSHTSVPESRDDKQLEDSTTAIAVASAAVIGSEPSSGDALSLQFGSFGLGGLDMNWSAPEKKPSEQVRSPIVQKEITSQPVPTVSAAVAPSPPPAASSAPTNPVVSNNMSSNPMSSTGGIESSSGFAPPQMDVRSSNPSSSSLHLPTVSTGANGSGMFPMLAMGPGGSFAPANYGGPYMVPPLHGYSPALGSYDNGSELGSSRGPNLAPPGSLPLYDPTNLPPMASGNGKYGGIPGLGDMSGLAGVQSGVSKDGLQVNGADIDKGNGLGTSGLGSGMDPLAGPYMMPGYPSMQYPMYTFPTGPYGPPGMAPPGPSPFPYPAAGQVSSQGGRGAFGFDDGSVGLGGNSRNGTGLGESMYTPGGYLNNSMSHNGNHKGGSDGSYKSMRGNSGGGLSGMGMGGGMVPGMGYGDYGGAMGGVGNNVGGPGGWGNRQGNGMRADGSSGMISNGPMGGAGGNGASQGSSGYGDGPGAAAGGYWTPQQGGYYP